MFAIISLLAFALSRLSCFIINYIPARMLHQDKVAINEAIDEKRYESNFSLKNSLLSSAKVAIFNKGEDGICQLAWDCLFISTILFTFYHFGFTDKTYVIAIISFILLILTRIDINEMLLPDSLLLALLGVGFISNVYIFPFVVIEDAVIAMTGVFYGIYAFIKTFEFLRDKELMGRGDIKLYSVSFMFIPASVFGSHIVISSLFFLVHSFIYNALYKKENSNPFPFGPAICLSLYAHILFGDVFGHLIGILQ